MQIPDLDTLSLDDLKKLMLGVLEELARITAENAGLRVEINQLKGLKGIVTLTDDRRDKTSTQSRSRGSGDLAPCLHGRGSECPVRLG
jgi:hypothetical protein